MKERKKLLSFATRGFNPLSRLKHKRKGKAALKDLVAMTILTLLTFTQAHAYYWEDDMENRHVISHYSKQYSIKKETGRGGMTDGTIAGFIGNALRCRFVSGEYNSISSMEKEVRSNKVESGDITDLIISDINFADGKAKFLGNYGIVDVLAIIGPNNDVNFVEHTKNGSNYLTVFVENNQYKGKKKISTDGGEDDYNLVAIYSSHQKNHGEGRYTSAQYNGFCSALRER